MMEPIMEGYPTDPNTLQLTFAKLQLVENSGLSCSIKTNHQDAHFLFAELSAEKQNLTDESELAQWHARRHWNDFSNNDALQLMMKWRDS